MPYNWMDSSISFESTAGCNSDPKAMMVISTKANAKASLQTFAMLLEINRKRLLKLKCQNYGGPFRS